MLSCFLNNCDQKFQYLNNSKYFVGIMMLVLNLGSKYLSLELSQNQEQILSNKIIRRFVLFSVIFVATRDIWVALGLTAVFIVLVSGIFNEDSDYCVVSKAKYFKEITKNDFDKASQIIKLYEIQEREKREQKSATKK